MRISNNCPAKFRGTSPDTQAIFRKTEQGNCLLDNIFIRKYSFLTENLDMVFYLIFFSAILSRNHLYGSLLFKSLPKYGHGALNIRRPYTTDVPRYT